jgi:CRISPR-associated protein Cas1
MQFKRHPMISPTQRTNISFLENVGVEISDGALIYKKSEDGSFSDYNIPYANTSMVLLGKGIVISRASLKRLSENGVMVCFCGDDSESVAATTESFQVIEPQIAYRTRQYMHQWGSIISDPLRTSAAAKFLLKERISFTKKMWEILPEALDYGLYPEEIKPAITTLMKAINDTSTSASQGLFKASIIYERSVHNFAAPTYGFNIPRQPGSEFDISNRYLDVANYFAYGYASVALHGLAIPFSSSIFIGNSHRSGLIFDIASLIMDGICLPIALEAAMSGRDDEEMSKAMQRAMQEHNVLEYLFKTIKSLSDIC